MQATQQQGPYTLEILSKHGEVLPTHGHKGRFYVQGSVGARYIIRITNPTARRIEAVVSVDGLDVIDGKAADFVTKRGYVVPARGEVRIEGWRTSTSSVATFRFSSVRHSYAGRKGVPRNVGVIGVAIFEEKEAPQVIVQEPVPDRDTRFDDVDDGDWDADDYWGGDSAGNAPRGGAPSKSKGTSSADRSAPEAEEAAPPAPSRLEGSAGRGAPAETKRAPSESRRSRRCCGERRERPGLGTEFGESRRSAVQWTRFERKNVRVPDAVAELRYNDTDGLRAMGIAIENPVPWGEVETRETANPFPNSNFASPPR